MAAEIRPAARGDQKCVKRQMDLIFSAVSPEIGNLLHCSALADGVCGVQRSWIREEVAAQFGVATKAVQPAA